MAQESGRGEFEPLTCRRGDRSAASAFLLDSIEFIPAPSCFVVAFAAKRLAAARPRFAIDEPPGYSMFGSLRFSRVMSAETLLDVFTRTNVAPARLLTAEHIQVKHA